MELKRELFMENAGDVMLEISEEDVYKRQTLWRARQWPRIRCSGSTDI